MKTKTFIKYFFWRGKFLSGNSIIFLDCSFSGTGVFIKANEYIYMNILFFLSLITQIILTIIFVLIAVAYLTLLERKVMGGAQQRRGPNVVGFGGLLQPLADGLKLLVKETIIPSTSNSWLFIFGPVFTFMMSLMGWLIIPFGENGGLAGFDFGVIYSLAISSLGVYGIIISGWSSNSKYAFLGALRAAAQMISYEVSLGFILGTIFILSGSLHYHIIVESQLIIFYVLPLFPSAYLFYVSILAETNRAPFDFAEADQELVAGYNVEYAAMGFALFFLGEYCSMILMCSLTSLFFFGGWLNPFAATVLKIFSLLSVWLGIKVSFFIFCMIWIRASFPRYRYDQLMYLGWKVFLPFSLSWLFFVNSLGVLGIIN
jgi:NADH-quinone oxidoreductase subunit H